MLSLLSSNGKIVNLSSNLGELSAQGENIQKILTDDTLNSEKIIEIAKDLENQIKNEKLNGWNKSVYKASKALVNAYTRIVLKKLLKEEQSCLSVHPGWCKTEMGGSFAPSPILEGQKEFILGLWKLLF